MNDISISIQRLLELLNYDPNQKSFHSIGNFWIHSELSQTIDFINQWDSTGKFALIHLASLCRQYIKDKRVDVIDILNDPHLLDSFKEMKDIVDSDCVKDVKNSMFDSMSQFMSMMGGTNLLGNKNQFEEAIEDSIYSTIKELKKLKFEVYMKSNQPLSLKGVKCSSKVAVFNSLAECVVSLENGEDGLGIVYISNPETIDGYFGFFIKSNGNMFSLNERCDEQYIGQHATRRNGRYIYDAKAMDLFPYDALCKFGGGDYKGYATDITIDEDKLDIFDVEKVDSSIGMRMLICMVLIIKKFDNEILTQEPIIINSLLPQNIKLIEGTSTSLIKTNGSSIIKRMNEVKFHFDKDKLVRNENLQQQCSLPNR